jgi:hypothetical protein
MLLDREHNRYARHANTTESDKNAESAVHFFQQRSHSIDTWNRQDAKQIAGDFFNLETYQEALGVTARRLEPPPRLRPADFYDPLDPACEEQPPARKTLQRRLDDFLYLIVRRRDTGRWTVPSVALPESVSLRTAVEQALVDHHGGGLDSYLFSNAPSTVLRPESAADTAAPASKEPLSDPASGERTFVYVAHYLTGRPDFNKVEPAADDHAWVSRFELCQYEFEGGVAAQRALEDVMMDGAMAGH